MHEATGTCAASTAGVVQAHSIGVFLALHAGSPQVQLEMNPSCLLLFSMSFVVHVRRGSTPSRLSMHTNLSQLHCALL